MIRDPGDHGRRPSAAGCIAAALRFVGLPSAAGADLSHLCVGFLFQWQCADQRFQPRTFAHWTSFSLTLRLDLKRL
jgi:hypothetical protein